MTDAKEPNNGYEAAVAPKMGRFTRMTFEATLACIGQEHEEIDRDDAKLDEVLRGIASDLALYEEHIAALLGLSESISAWEAVIAEGSATCGRTWRQRRQASAEANTEREECAKQRALVSEEMERLRVRVDYRKKIRNSIREYQRARRKENIARRRGTIRLT